MDSVFMVWYSAGSNDEEEHRIVGVYATQGDAEAAIARAARCVEFREAPENLVIDQCPIGRDGWVDGFISWDEALSAIEDEE